MTLFVITLASFVIGLNLGCGFVYWAVVKPLKQSVKDYEKLLMKSIGLLSQATSAVSRADQVLKEDMPVVSPIQIKRLPE